MSEGRKKYDARLIDRAKLGAGPWDGELDDEVAWKHPTENLGCVLRRNKFAGSWVVLIALPPTHALFGADPCVDLPELLQVSGTVYSGNYAYEIPGLDTAGWWWVGFDTHHPLAPIATERVAKKAAVMRARGASEHPAVKLVDDYERERRGHYKTEGQCRQLLAELVSLLAVRADEKTTKLK